MDRRSTNEIGYTHFGGDVTAQVNSSHGVRLSGGSTGGVVEAVGDDTNVAIRLRAQGAGVVFLATGSQSIVAASTAFRLGNASTSDIVFLQKYRIDWTVPALSSAGAAGASADSTVTVTGLTTGSVLLFGQTQQWNSTVDPGVIVTVRCSTVDELKITSHNVNASSLSGSTKSGTLLQFAF